MEGPHLAIIPDSGDPIGKVLAIGEIESLQKRPSDKPEGLRQVVGTPGAKLWIVKAIAAWGRDLEQGDIEKMGRFFIEPDPFPIGAQKGAIGRLPDDFSKRAQRVPKAVRTLGAGKIGPKKFRQKGSVLFAKGLDRQKGQQSQGFSGKGALKGGSPEPHFGGT
jgi:hypothetical protein